jgi:NAD dependent epimerase/dehydratase
MTRCETAGVAKWSGRLVLVTGAGGFIGSHLVEELARMGARVRAFVRYNSRGQRGWLDFADSDVLDAIEMFPGDLANPEAVEGAMRACDVVFHLGALIPIPYSYRHPREFVSANIVGTLNILEAARRTDVRRVVHTSTSEVYGTAQSVPIDEEHRLHPQSPYAATKVAADQLALSFHRSFGTPVAIARPFNTYGPRQSARAVIPTIVTQALARDEVDLGATSPTRDFLYVQDTVAGMVRCAEKEGLEGEVVNLGSGVEISIGELVERIFRLMGRDVPVAVDAARLRPRGSEVERLLAGTEKAASLLGWKPSVGLDEGLRRTMDWLMEFSHAYKPFEYNV